MKTRKHTQDCLDANDDTSVLKGKCICPKPARAPMPIDTDALMTILLGNGYRRESADRIIRAVNAHEELVLKLKWTAMKLRELGGSVNYTLGHVRHGALAK